MSLGSLSREYVASTFEEMKCTTRMIGLCRLDKLPAK